MIRLLRENETLRELLAGTWLFGIVTEIILVIFFPPVWYRTIGLLAGLIAASGMAIHIAYCLDITVELDEKGANSYVRKMTIIRYFAVCALMVVVALLKIGDPISYVIGTLALKIGAYLQPVVHKTVRFFNKDNSDNDESLSVDTSISTQPNERDININDKGGE